MKRIVCSALGAWLMAAFVCAAESADTNHNYARWEKEISAFERMDKTNPPPKGLILFTGNSTIRNWKSLSKDFPNHPVLNRGFGGSELLDSTHFAERIIFPYEPSLIFLRSGGNDLARGKTPEQVFADFQEFVAKVHARLPNTVILFISTSSSPKRWAHRDLSLKFNALAKEFIAGKPYLKYIEVYDMVLGPDGNPRPELFVEDKLHFTAAGYALLADRVRPFLPKAK